MTYSDGKLPAMRPLEGERATKWRGGAVRQEPQMTLHPGRPPFGGQGSLCTSSLHAASYTLLPLRGISPQGETRDCAAARHFSTGKHVTGFAARFAPL